MPDQSVRIVKRRFIRPLLNFPRTVRLIDLTTLQPARYMNSVAIVSSDSGLGDALSTGVFCMPVEKGQALIEQLNDVEALWMLSDETMVQSNGWGK